MRVRMPLLVAGLLLVLGRLPVRAEDPATVLPDGPRDATIRTPEEFLGFAIGSRHARHDQVVAYLTYLADVSERVTLIPYGRTHGARPLLVAAITSQENSSRLDELRKRRRRLTSGKYAGNLDNELLVMYMGYSVHGDESSAVNAAPLVAYHLASATSDQVSTWLDDGVFLIDPALNPDGVDRFANWANENRGRFPSASSQDREHHQPWPGGRTNYYWFDLNRDWLPRVHPESQGRLRLFHSWKPNVVLDFHEMSGTASYFFQPGIPERNNPFSPQRNLELTRRFSAEHARVMDAAGELYFTEERYDDFYVGKGSTYPDLHGAVGILFEQGSTRGLKLKNDRTDRHFRDTVANQVRTSLSSLRVATRTREELLEFQTSFYNGAFQAGRASPVSGYLLSGTPSRVDAAARLLRAHSIDVFQPESTVHFEGNDYAADEVVIVPCAQAEYTFIRSLMEPLQDFQENLFYDVSTWHLPSALDLNMHRLTSDIPATWLAGRWQPPQPEEPPATKSNLENVAGFVFSPLELGSPRVAAALQRAGLNLRVTTQKMVTQHGDRTATWPPGTFLVLRQSNLGNWEAALPKVLAAGPANDVSILPVPSGLTPVGPDFGSSTSLALPRCRPLLIVGRGTRAYSAGVLWHHLDVRMGQPCTLADTERFSGLDLHEYTCVILPEGTYDSWSSGEVDRLRGYVRGGGTVIATASSIRWLAGRKLIELADAPASPGETSSRQTLQFGDARDAQALESIAGAFFQTRVDPTHPLAYGLPDAIVPVFRDHASAFAPPRNPLQVAAKYENVLAGYVSERNRKRLAGTAAAWIENSGSGRFILLADNPVFRGYVRGSERFLTNALLLGPAIRVPAFPPDGESDQAGGSNEGHNHE